MLDLHKYTRLFIRRAYKSIFIIIFSFSSYLYGVNLTPASCEHEWAARYFNSVDERTSIEEMIDFLVSLRIVLQAKGYQMPSLAELCLTMRSYLIEKNIEIDENNIERIYNEILKREDSIVNHSSSFQLANKSSKFKIIKVKRKKKTDNELKMSDEFAKGFVKALGGALLCIIPHPVTWGIGAALVADGIKDMLEHVGDAPREELAEGKMRNLPPPAKYSSP